MMQQPRHARELVVSAQATGARALVNAVPDAAAPNAIGHGLDASGTTLAIAADRVPLKRVIRYAVDGLAEKDFASNFATAGIFGGAAVLFILLVFAYGWRDRFLIVAVLLGAIALFALLDLNRVTWLTTYTFTLHLDDGTTCKFTTTSENEALRLRDALNLHLL